MLRMSGYGCAIIVLAFSSLVFADPPARVGRLSLAENGVNMRLDNHDPGMPASLNWPISSGAELDTERRGRAEVWIGATAFRLAGGSQLAFPAIDDRQVAAQLQDGTVAVSVMERERSDNLNVTIPEGRVSFLTAGRYRLDVLPDHSELIVQAGTADFADAYGNTAVLAGQRAIIYSGSHPRLESNQRQDAFDYWVAERESAALASVSRRYVSSAMTGMQDLDAHGEWRTLPDYGAVWYPRDVNDDWAPYRYGRWAWVEPWGWTWIDQMSWGFAPFHYGRWVRVGERWGWVPGNAATRPVYAPALVAWIGKPGWSASFSSGAAPASGWFPLAPREVYVPAFTTSADYVRRVNVSHVRDAAQVDRAVQAGAAANYLYRASPQAVTVVPATHLREGRIIQPTEVQRQDRHELDRLPPARSTPETGWSPPPGAGQQRQDNNATGRQPPAMMDTTPSRGGFMRQPANQQIAPPPAVSPPPERRLVVVPAQPVVNSPATTMAPMPVASPMPHDSRELARPLDAAPRPREIAPQAAPAPVAMPQAARTFAPPPAPQPQASPEPRAKNRDDNAQRHHDHEDNRNR